MGFLPSSSQGARGGNFLSPAKVKRKRKDMKFGEYARAAGLMVKAVWLAVALLLVPQAAMAQAPVPSPAAAEAPAAAATPATDQAAAPAAGSYQRMAPTPGKGMPVAKGVWLQDQYSPTGRYGHWIHDKVLFPIITIISLFVRALLLFVIVRFNKRANPVPSKTSHNTFIEVVWTLVPVLILVGIAVPSIDLLARQFKPPHANALTIKATGNQWYWSYTYPDNGGFEIVSKMLNEQGRPEINAGIRFNGTDPSDGPNQLEVDNRLVVPVGEDIRFQVTASDVIHSFAVPSLWFKIDAVPGRINEHVLHIEKPGVYYGQCSELCGIKHGFMPIAIEALPREQFNAWVLSQSGGVIDGQPKPAATPASAAAAPATPATPAPGA
jgi:cytochrome c oxidase subunit 2